MRLDQYRLSSNDPLWQLARESGVYLEAARGFPIRWHIFNNTGRVTTQRAVTESELLAYFSTGELPE